jgi:hypothetical protein
MPPGTRTRATLTAKQRRLRREIEDIAAMLRMDHWNIEQFEPDERTTMLEVMKNSLIRGEIVLRYTLIDEYLTAIICYYFFRRSQSFRELWRTKKFRIFNHQIMDEMFLLPKMQVVHAIASLPGEVQDNITRINRLRNDVAHSFFPENRKAHMPAKKRLYRGIDIFTKAGVQKFLDDFYVVLDCLQLRAFG